MFGKPSLVIADPDILKKILVKDFWNFRNRVAVMKTEEQLPQAFFLNAMMLGGASAPRLPRRSAQRKWKGWYPWSKIGWEIDANIRRRCQYRNSWGYYLNRTCSKWPFFFALLHSHPVKGKFINHEASNEQNAAHASNLIFNKIVRNFFVFHSVGKLRKVFKFNENASKG